MLSAYESDAEIQHMQYKKHGMGEKYDLRTSEILYSRIFVVCLLLFYCLFGRWVCGEVSRDVGAINTVVQKHILHWLEVMNLVGKIGYTIKILNISLQYLVCYK